jgi:hypothetical protein
MSLSSVYQPAETMAIFARHWPVEPAGFPREILYLSRDLV